MQRRKMYPASGRGGMGDYNPAFSQGPVGRMPMPPISGGIPNVTGATIVSRPAPSLDSDQKRLYDTIAMALMDILPRIVLNTVAFPFRNWLAATVFVNQALPAIQLDALPTGIRDRKAVLILNPNVAANVLWISHTDPAVNRGLPVPGNFGSISMPLSSNDAKIWGIMAAGGANQPIAVVQFFD